MDHWESPYTHRKAKPTLNHLIHHVFRDWSSEPRCFWKNFVYWGDTSWIWSWIPYLVAKFRFFSWLAFNRWELATAWKSCFFPLRARTRPLWDFWIKQVSRTPANGPFTVECRWAFWVSTAWQPTLIPHTPTACFLVGSPACHGNVFTRLRVQGNTLLDFGIYFGLSWDSHLRIARHTEVLIDRGLESTLSVDTLPFFKEHSFRCHVGRVIHCLKTLLWGQFSGSNFPDGVAIGKAPTITGNQHSKRLFHQVFSCRRHPVWLGLSGKYLDTETQPECGLLTTLLARFIFSVSPVSGFPCGLSWKNVPAMWWPWCDSSVWKDPLEKEKGYALKYFGLA